MFDARLTLFVCIAGMSLATTARASIQVVKVASPPVHSPVHQSTRKKPFQLSGVWVLADSFMDKQDQTMVATPGRLSEINPADVAVFMQAPVLKGSYEEDRQNLAALARTGKAVDDSGAMCLPQGMPAFWVGPYAFEILQTRAQINISQEWNEQTRRIYVDGRPHPEDYDPSYNGHSIGHWDGDVLVVDTVGIRAETKLATDSHHSDALHIIERIQQIAPDLIRIEMTAYDPKAFAQPWVAIYRLRHKPGMEIQEYSCEDNNRNTVDANGVTRAVIAPSK